MAEREQGNPHPRRTDREDGRVGRDRTPIALPAQAKLEHSAQPGARQTVGVYTVGAPKRPRIVHDDGFLALGRRSATLADRAKLAKWNAMLEAGEALRPDLSDALAAYRHFLEGKGARRAFSYDRYVLNDASGRVTLQNLIRDLQMGIVGIWLADSDRTVFSVTTTAIPCGAVGSRRFPYPATENWQKALGAHYVWLSGDASVSPGAARPPEGLGTPSFTVAMVVHAEDRYNFNPGAADIATGIPDSDNGVFEMTGLAHQYDQFAELRRTLRWEGVTPYASLAALRSGERHRQPTTNRRLRNRI